MEYYGQNRDKYSLCATPFKKGGEGSVYDIAGKPDYVAKIYHKNVVTAELESKIRYMTKNPPAKSILNQIAWPQDFLIDSTGKFIGFIMPKLEINSELGDLYVYPPKKIQLTNEQKVIVAINICRVISEIHRAGYTFGDFNPCNIGVNLTTGNVAFLDTDSYHIYDKNTGNTYRCVVCLNGYVAPELIQKCKGTDYKKASLPTFTQETDRFSLAIHIFKLLFNGFTPYNGILETERSSQASPGVGNAAIEQDHYCFKSGNKPLSMAVPPLSAFPRALQDLFTRAFIDGRNNPKLRPTAEEWDKALCDYRSSLVQCKNNPLHQHDKSLLSCPYCEADARYNMMLSIGSVYGSSGVSSQQISFSQPVTVPSVSTPSSYNPLVPQTSSSSVSAASLSSSIASAKAQPRVGFRKKLKIILICVLAVILIGAGIGGGVYYKLGMDKVNATIDLINYLPDSTISDYSRYDDLIAEAYSTYSDLAGWQKDKVDNRDKLLNIVAGYNDYKVAELRTAVSGVSVETVDKDDSLSTSVDLYKKLNTEQRALLTADEIYTLDNYVKVLDVIKSINAINDDVVNKYNEVSSVNRIYYSIDEQFVSLVYNYELVATFEERISFLNLFNFTEVAGGYSIALKDGSELSGSVEIPDKYNGQSVVEVAESAFKDNRRLTSIIIPDSVIKIGKGALG